MPLAVVAIMQHQGGNNASADIMSHSQGEILSNNPHHPSLRSMKSCVMNAISCWGLFVGALLGLVCITWIVWSPGLLIISIIDLANGYSAAKVANGADPGDFVSVGWRCRIEGIDYQAITGKTSNSDGGFNYHCNERWDYTFVVLEVEDVLDVETDADYFGLRSITEERLACRQESCESCGYIWGKDHLYDGQPIVDGYYATECWALKEGGAHHPFWSCSESNADNATACYLLNDPNEVLNDRLKYANRDIMSGWILFAPSVLGVVVICSFFCIGAYKHRNQ